MATLSVQTLSETGTAALTFTAATETGDEFPNAGRQCFVVKNAGAETDVIVTATKVVTSESIPSFGDMTKTASTVTVTAGNTGYLGPFPVRSFNADDGVVEITYNQVSSVSVAVIELKNG